MKLDQTAHTLGALLLISLGVLSQRIEGKRLKQIVVGAFVLVLAVVLADAVMHLLPNTIAGFIYGSHHHYAPRQFLSDK
jgi:hypothetical protein